MNQQKNVFQLIGDWWANRQPKHQNHKKNLSKWLPTPGNVVFTILVLGLLILTQNVWAKPLQSALNAPGPSATTINYQGRLANPDGTPVSDGSYGMTFALYDADTAGNLVWGPENHTAVPVSDGLFSVGLGSETSGGIPTTTWNGDRYLEITVDGETLSPRELIRSVPIAGMALTVPDGSITNNKLNLNGSLDLGDSPSSDMSWDGNYRNLMLKNIGGNIRNISSGSIFFFIDSDNNETNASFRVVHNDDHLDGNYESLMKLYENGTLWVKGSFESGAFVENNLQTDEEIQQDTIPRFSQGDVLCWATYNQKLELCAAPNARLIMAVADNNGKPIVMGAELIKVLGPVQTGDILVSSNVPGYAMVNNDPLPGTVIAQALEDFNGESGFIKAMIRKW